MDGAALPISRPFAWYAMVHDDARGGYHSQVVPLGKCADLAEFCRYLNHLPPPGAVFDGRHAWRLGGKHWGYGLCFFEEGTRPEWEDPRNAHGTDLVWRGTLGAAALTEAWHSLLLLFVNGELEGATGARVVYKLDRRGEVLHKLEVWTRSVECADVALCLAQGVGLEFASVPRRMGGRK